MTDKKFDLRFKLGYLHPRYFTSWLGILTLGVLAYVPACIRDSAANILVKPLSRIHIRQKHNVMVNFSMAYPKLSPTEKEEMYRNFLRVGIKVILGYGQPLFRSKRYLKKHFLVQGKEYLDEAIALKKPIIFMAPHAWAIDHCGLYLSSSTNLQMCTMMHTSGNKVYDWFMNSMRMRFGGKIYERSAGIRSIVSALKNNYHTFFLPDQDLGGKSSIYVPFFGNEKSTLVVLPKMTAMANAVVVPLFSCYNEEKHSYELVFDHYLDPYPTKDLKADVRTMNAEIEKLITGREKQYMWFLKLYKNRSDGIGVY